MVCDTHLFCHVVRIAGLPSGAGGASLIGRFFKQVSDTVGSALLKYLSTFITRFIFVISDEVFSYNSCSHLTSVWMLHNSCYIQPIYSSTKTLLLYECTWGNSLR